MKVSKHTLSIPAMTPPVVLNYLKEIGSNWQGKGIAIELGSWMGATAAALLEGLVEVNYDRPFYSYDKWKANEEQVHKAKKQKVFIEGGQNLKPLFLQNTKRIYDNVIAERGKIQEKIKTYNAGPIEICLFDAPKKEPVFSTSINALKEYWIPGVTIFGLLDYYFYKSKPVRDKKPFLAPVEFIQKNWECFQKIAEWPDQCSCVFFKYVKEIE